MDYYSPFWGPEAISIVVKPQDKITCRSSTLAVLADSGPFHGLLLTNLWSMRDFHDWRTLGCVYVSFINTPWFVRFRALSWTITHRFGVPKQFPWLSNPKGVLTCRSSRLAVWAKYGPFLGLLLSFGVLKWFAQLTNPRVRLRVGHQH